MIQVGIFFHEIFQFITICCIHAFFDGTEYCFTDNNSSYIVLSLPRFCCCARYPKVLSLAKVTRPVSAGSIPVIILRRVDLPAPLIPTMAAFSWSSILNEHDFIITSVPNDLLILFHICSFSDLYKYQCVLSKKSFCRNK